MLYLADAYGVYTGDYEVEGEASLDYSQLIYGGMTPGEVGLIEDFVAGGGHLVAEFNTFASPTGAGTRGRLENLLGARWSGWTGRYFHNLADEREVPAWASRAWRQHYGEDWNFRGAGYLFVHEDTRLFVLRESIDVSRPGLTIEIDQEAPLTAGALSGMRFNYWFDVIVPAPGTEVLASFRIHADHSGRAILERFEVPAEFPALVMASESPLRIYMAGDFSDAAGALGPWWAEGLPWLNNNVLNIWFPRGADQEPFYWGFYIPMIRNLLRHYQP